MSDRAQTAASHPDPYRVLDVPRDADAATVSRAYWKLAKQFHPDRNASPLARRLMLVVNDAYETLKNADRRAAYDAAFPRSPGGMPPHMDPPLAAARPAEVRPTATRSSGPAPTPTAFEESRSGPILRRAASRQPQDESTPAQRARSRTLEFGRYAGRTIAEVARVDPDYLEWFVRTPLGRSFASEVAATVR